MWRSQRSQCRCGRVGGVSVGVEESELRSECVCRGVRGVSVGV